MPISSSVHSFNCFNAYKLQTLFFYEILFFLLKNEILILIKVILILNKNICIFHFHIVTDFTYLF